MRMDDVRLDQQSAVGGSPNSEGYPLSNGICFSAGSQRSFSCLPIRIMFKSSDTISRDR